MPKIIKHGAWAYHDGPVKIVTIHEDEEDYFVTASFYGLEINKGGFLSQEDAFAYGLAFVIQQVALLTDRLRTIHETEIMNE